MTEEPTNDFGLAWRPARGRCFHPTGQLDDHGRALCCTDPVAVRGQLVVGGGTGYVVDACPRHADRLRAARPLR
jgi:hypothetical protein